MDVNVGDNTWWVGFLLCLGPGCISGHFFWLKMLCGFEKKIAAFIKANRLFESDDRIVLGISGGADSTALLYAMVSLKSEDILNADVICAHINHQLRGVDADVDEDFVLALAHDLLLPVTTK